MRFTIWHLILAMSCLSVGLAAAISVHSYISNGIVDHYRLDWATEAIVGFLRDNPDCGPKSWEDLDPIFAEIQSASGSPFSVQSIQHSVVVDWRLLNMDWSIHREGLSSAQFIWLSGTGPSKRKDEVIFNERIREALRARLAGN